MDGELCGARRLEEATVPLEPIPAPSTPPPGGGERTLQEAGRRAGVWSALKRTLFGKHSLAILDQLVVSGTRFTTSVIVGRVCGPHELGDYTLGFTLFCIGGCLQTALISQPFTIYGNY